MYTEFNSIYLHMIVDNTSKRAGTLIYLRSKYRDSLMKVRKIITATDPIHTPCYCTYRIPINGIEKCDIFGKC